MTVVLLVEDDPDRVELTEHALARCEPSPDVTVAHDGREALDELRERDQLPRLVLLDLDMPRADGFDVLEARREHPRLQGVPFVVLTSSTQAEDRRRCYELGANAYVPKPVDFDEFQQTLETLVDFWLDVNEPGP